MLDRICFQNPDNIIEMFYIPEDLSCKNNIKGEKTLFMTTFLKKSRSQKLILKININLKLSKVKF